MNENFIKVYLLPKINCFYSREKLVKAENTKREGKNLIKINYYSYEKLHYLSILKFVCVCNIRNNINITMMKKRSHAFGTHPPYPH